MMKSPKITMFMVMSLDGIIVRDDSEPVSNWSSKEDQMHFCEVVNSFDCLITGRNSFFGSAMSEIPHYILTPVQDELNDTSNEKIIYLSGDVKSILDKVVSDGHKNIALLGGPETNYGFLSKNLVDEVVLTVEPRMFGKGKHLNIDKLLETELELVEHKQLNKRGTLLLRYKKLIS